MVRGNLNGLILRSGFTLAAAMMMTTAVMGQDTSPTGGDAVTLSTDVVDAGEVQNRDDLNAGSEGIAVGEPDPNGGGGLGDPPNDGTDQTTGEDGSGDGTDDWVDDGTDGGSDGTVDDGSGDDGTDGGSDGTVDDGSGDDGTGDGTDDWVDDGTGGGTDGTGDDGTVVDGTVVDGTDDWVDYGTDGGSDGTVDDVTIDGSVDWVDDGTVVDEGEVVIDYLDGGPVQCDDCDFTAWDLPLEAYQMGEGAVGDVAPQAAQNDAPAAKPKRSSSRTFAASGMAECLLQHPQLPWICEWQNGVGH